MKWSITAGLFLLIVGLCLVTGNPSHADTSGITITPISGLVTTEAGVIATFEISLNTSPTANVIIGLSSNDLTEGTVSPSSVTFNSTNWITSQTVTVTGVDDGVADGNISYRIITAPARSTDTAYNGLNADDVDVTNNDNDVAGITVTPTSGLFTTESGGTTTFIIVLNTHPLYNVDIGLSSNNSSEGTVLLPGVTFTPVNWNIPQTVTVKGEDDAVAGDNIIYSIITAPASSTDTAYNGLDADDVDVTNNDNETPGITVNPTLGLVTTRAGGAATFTVRLNKQPKWDVFIGVSSNDSTEGTVSPSSVVFTSVNWNTPQTVTVKGEDDAVVGDNIIYSIITAPASSTDTAYNGLNAYDVEVTNTDNDTAGITVSRTSGLVTTEAGVTDTFTIMLNRQPKWDVFIGLSSNDSTEGTVSPSSVIFTKANWNTSRTVTVTGVDDSAIDGNITYSIVIAAAVSDDSGYNGLDAADVSATNNDNDTTTCPIGKPQTPSPINGSSNVSTNVTLSWAPAANASLYNVYLSTSSIPTYYGNTSNSSYQLLQLNYSTKYYWKVVAKNSCGTNDSDIWEFTTATDSAPAATTTPIPTPTPVSTITLHIGGTSASFNTSSSGVIQQAVNVTSADGTINLHIQTGTTALYGEGKPLDQLNMASLNGYHDPSGNRQVVAAFDFNPSGATFNPGIEITLRYDPKAIPSGMSESKLVVAFYNESAASWEYISNGVVNTSTHAITFTATHFTVFAIQTPAEMPSPVDNGENRVWLWNVLVLDFALTLVMLAIFLIASRRSREKREASGTRLRGIFRIPRLRRAPKPTKEQVKDKKKHSK